MLVVPQADTRSRTFPVKIRIQNEIDDETGPLIKAGMLARVTLPTGPQSEALLVPKDAIVRGGKSPIVFVGDPSSPGSSQGKVRPGPVSLGVTSNSLIEVKGSIKTGELVVVRGNERLRPGQDVNVIQTLSPLAEQASAAR